MKRVNESECFGDDDISKFFGFFDDVKMIYILRMNVYFSGNIGITGFDVNFTVLDNIGVFKFFEEVHKCLPQVSI